MNQNHKDFLEAFNEIDAFLRKELRFDQKPNFVDVLDEFCDRRYRFQSRDELKRLARLRNFIVHDKQINEPIIEVPDKTVKQIRTIRDSLLKPSLCGDLYKCTVHKLAPGDRISSLLENIKKYDFSQFPVYDENRLVGLVTENGITKWISTHMVEQGSLVELGDHTVDEVLNCDEKRQSYALLGRAQPVDAVINCFEQQRKLEAIIITENGKDGETPLGIATVYDVVRYRQ
jgi:predicted transcriptional regulator